MNFRYYFRIYIIYNKQNIIANIIYSEALPDQFLGCLSVTRGIEQIRDFCTVLFVFHQTTETLLDLRLWLRRRRWKRGWGRGWPVKEGFLFVLATFRWRRWFWPRHVSEHAWWEASWFGSCLWSLSGPWSSQRL